MFVCLLVYSFVSLFLSFSVGGHGISFFKLSSKLVLVCIFIFFHAFILHWKWSFHSTATLPDCQNDNCPSLVPRKKNLKQSGLPAFWKKRSKAHKRLKKTRLIRRNRTIRAKVRGSLLFQATYKKQKTKKATHTHKQQKNKELIQLILCHLEWGKLAEGKGHEPDSVSYTHLTLPTSDGV